jgi:hypothetical protein
VDPRQVVDALGRHRAEFVVVGSAARYLLGEDIAPADVDVVINDSLANRIAVVDLLFCLGAEWTRSAPWRAQQRLGRLIDDLPFDLDPSDAAERLASAVADVTHTVAGLTEGLSSIRHYEL